MCWPSVRLESDYLLQWPECLQMARPHALLTPGCIVARPPAILDAVTQIAAAAAGSKKFGLGNQD